MNTNECKPLRIYVAGPYTAPTIEEIQENVNNAIEVGVSLYEKGHFPLLPQLTHYIDTYELTSFHLKYADYMRCDLSWLSVAEALFFMRKSPGACAELVEAERLGLRVFRSLEEVPRGISLIKSNNLRSHKTFSSEARKTLNDMKEYPGWGVTGW